MSTDTDTLLLEFPNQPLMTNVYIRNHAKAAVPLLWSRVQVSGIPILILPNVDLKLAMAVKVPCMPCLFELSCCELGTRSKMVVHLGNTASMDVQF